MPNDFTFGGRTSDLIAVARRQSIGDLLRRSALRYPDKVAVIDGEVRFTFSEFDAVVSRSAASMRSRGLAQGDRLALLSHNSWQYGVLAFGAARLGLVLTPINFMLGSEEVAFILEHSAASGFVVEQPLAALADEALAMSGIGNVVRGVIPDDSGEVPPGWEHVEG